MADLAWPTTPPRSGPVVLRPFGDDDVAMLRDLATDPYVPLVGSLPYLADDDEARAWITRQHDRLRTGDGFSFAIADAASGTALGTAGLTLLDERRGSVGYTVAPRSRGGGVAADGLRALVGFAWTLPGLVRLEAFVEPGNTASLRTAEAAGFVPEVLLRHHVEIGDRRRDVVRHARHRPS